MQNRINKNAKRRYGYSRYNNRSVRSTAEVRQIANDNADAATVAERPAAHVGGGNPHKRSMSVHYSSKTDDWATPIVFFKRYDGIYNLTLDVCASNDNHKCPRYYTVEMDGLKQDWKGEVCWMNPPYGRPIKHWVKKAYEESLKGATVVCLVPARTDTNWWHDYCMKGDIEFIRGRLKFGDGKSPAPFPSAVVVFRPKPSFGSGVASEAAPDNDNRESVASVPAVSSPQKKSVSKLFSTDNAKARKAKRVGWLNAIHYLPPDRLSGRNLCPHASPGCSSMCLGWFSGNARSYPNIVRTARIARAKWLRDNPEGYLTEMAKQIVVLSRQARRKDMKLCVRLNGSSDLPWENMIVPETNRNLMQTFPDIAFVDYTKSLKRMLDWCSGKMPNNYHLTFSRSEINEVECQTVLRAGGNVAVVFDQLPTEWWQYPVIDGDTTDLRHLDNTGVVVGLLPKGPEAKKDKSGMVVRLRKGGLKPSRDRHSSTPVAANDNVMKVVMKLYREGRYTEGRQLLLRTA